MTALDPPATMARFNVVGAGRVGQTLARLWHHRAHFAIADVCTTTLASAQAACATIGAGHPVAAIAAMGPADVWMLAVPDAQLATCAKALADHHATHSTSQPATNPPAPHPAAPHRQRQPIPAPLVFHCSGAHSSAVLAPLADRGWRVASAHCILSFATVQAAMAQFPGTGCALEGDASACADVLRPAFTAIGARCFEVASSDKLLYHAAAVFATNFLPVLQATAETLWLATGVPQELIPQLRATLLTNAVANITKLGPQAALTGPAARGDTAAITRQAAALAKWDAPTAAAYGALSTLALRLASKQGT